MLSEGTCHIAKLQGPRNTEHPVTLYSVELERVTEVSGSGLLRMLLFR